MLHRRLLFIPERVIINHRKKQRPKALIAFTDSLWGETSNQLRRSTNFHHFVSSQAWAAWTCFVSRPLESSPLPLGCSMPAVPAHGGEKSRKPFWLKTQFLHNEINPPTWWNAPKIRTNDKLDFLPLTCDKLKSKGEKIVNYLKLSLAHTHVTTESMSFSLVGFSFGKPETRFLMENLFFFTSRSHSSNFKTFLYRFNAALHSHFQ